MDSLLSLEVIIIIKEWKQQTGLEF
jgi:hypothetical protein